MQGRGKRADVTTRTLLLLLFKKVKQHHMWMLVPDINAWPPLPREQWAAPLKAGVTRSQQVLPEKSSKTGDTEAQTHSAPPVHLNCAHASHQTPTQAC